MQHKFTEKALEQYLYWHKKNKKIRNRINQLIDNIKETPFQGLGKPEPLKGVLIGWWSRRIDG